MGGTLLDQHNILMGEPSLKCSNININTQSHKYILPQCNGGELTETHRSDLTLRDKDGKLEGKAQIIIGGERCKEGAT